MNFKAQKYEIYWNNFYWKMKLSFTAAPALGMGAKCRALWTARPKGKRPKDKKLNPAKSD